MKKLYRTIVYNNLVEYFRKRLTENDVTIKFEVPLTEEDATVFVLEAEEGIINPKYAEELV